MQQMMNEIRGRVVPKTKKERIIGLFRGGMKDIESIASLVGGKPSYVASVLLREGLIDRYFDLYTSTGQPMNIYSKYFQGKLGFKDVETAKRGVAVLEAAYRRFENMQDRAGQHHTLEMGLTMLDRARWTGKLAEAEVYRRWMVRKISTPLIDPSSPEALLPEAEEDPVDDRGRPRLRLAA